MNPIRSIKSCSTGLCDPALGGGLYLRLAKVLIPCVLLPAWAGCSEEAKDRMMHFFFEIPESRPAAASDTADAPGPQAAAQGPVEPADPASLRWILHPPFQDGRCAECHPRDNVLNAKDQDRKACRVCHQHMYENQKAPHMGQKLVEHCRDCHHPHRSHEPFMLRKPQRELCWDCHDEDEILESDAHLAIGDQLCTTCHDVHFSDREFMLKLGVAKSDGASPAQPPPSPPDSDYTSDPTGIEPKDFVDLRDPYFAALAADQRIADEQARELDAKISDQDFPFPPDDPAMIQAGAMIFATQCRRCHGPTLDGNGVVSFKRARKASLVRENRRIGWDTDAKGKATEYFHAVLEGQRVTGDPSMPPFAEKLSRMQVWQVVSFVRSRQIAANQ